jgi:hypothetical protein
MKATYRLEPLLKLRRRRVDAAAKVLAAANAAASASEQERLSAEAEKERQEAEVNEVRTFERSALESNQLTVADLQVAGQWEVGVAMEEAALARRIAERAEAEHQAKAAVTHCRAALAKRRADAVLAEKHRAAWVVATRKRADEQADEEVADIHRPKRSGA